MSANSKSEGSSALIKAQYLFHASARWVVIGGVDFETLDKDIVNFYYGTDGTELPGDPVYLGERATNTSLFFMASYNIDKEWVALGGFKATALDDEIKNSPLVEDDAYNAIFVGIAWKY
jgi:outer membrane scaffolding protein for murein synthesis (MipA/OmpV family)